MNLPCFVAFAAFSLLGPFSVFGQIGHILAKTSSRLEVVGSNVVSVGQIYSHLQKSETFRLRNISAEPISIVSLRPTCPCIRANIDKRLIPPGEEASVTLCLNPMSIHGAFKRGLWIETSDPGQKRFQLNLSGEVIPLFIGQPTEPVSFLAPDVNVVWTSRYTLAASTTGVSLAPPQISTNSNLRIAFTFITNATEKASYTLSLMISPLALGRAKAQIVLPVVGETRIPPIRIDLSARAGLILSPNPNQIQLPESEAPITRRLILRTDDPRSRPEELTWEPKGDGVTVQAEATRSGPGIVVTVQFTPEAVKRLRASKDAKLTFRYPLHTPAEVSVLPTEEEHPAAADKQ